MKKLTRKLVMYAGIAVLAMLAITGCNTETSREKFIGLQLYSLRDAMKEDVEGTVAQVGEIGYKFVEAAGYGDGQFYGMSPQAFKELCESNGLKFLGSHTGQDVPDSANWDKTMAWWDEAIQAHAEAGVEWIVQPWMGQTGYESLDGLKRYCEYFNAVGEKCNEQGIRFGYHNHANELLPNMMANLFMTGCLNLLTPKT